MRIGARWRQALRAPPPPLRGSPPPQAGEESAPRKPLHKVLEALRLIDLERSRVKPRSGGCAALDRSKSIRPPLGKTVMGRWEWGHSETNSGLITLFDLGA